MKLLRFGPEGQEKPGLLDAEGQIRDLSALLDDYTPRLLGREALRALAAIDPARLPLVQGPVRIGMPWSGMSKFVAIGLNYR
ncbi:ureidoglycolate lyase, partial [Klebsiella pneumoniae]|nr:ureidoglycolate lyase [Klebsiella pneumoniae]